MSKEHIMKLEDNSIGWAIVKNGKIYGRASKWRNYEEIDKVIEFLAKSCKNTCREKLFVKEEDKKYKKIVKEAECLK